MRFERYTFGSITIDGVEHDRDLVIDRGRIRKRKKSPSKSLRDVYGHTPLSANEDIPWVCDRLVIGTGAQGSLPLAPEVEHEAKRRGVDLLVMPTADAVDVLNGSMQDTNAVLHLTC